MTPNHAEEDDDEVSSDPMVNRDRHRFAVLLHRRERASKERRDQRAKFEAKIRRLRLPTPSSYEDCSDNHILSFELRRVDRRLIKPNAEEMMYLDHAYRSGRLARIMSERASDHPVDTDIGQLQRAQADAAEKAGRQRHREEKEMARQADQQAIARHRRHEETFRRSTVKGPASRTRSMKRRWIAATGRPMAASTRRPAAVPSPPKRKRDRVLPPAAPSSRKEKILTSTRDRLVFLIFLFILTISVNCTEF